MECLADDFVQEHLFDVLGPQRAGGALLQFRACSRAFCGYLRPRMVKTCREGLCSEDTYTRLAMLGLLATVGRAPSEPPNATAAGHAAAAAAEQLQNEDPDVRRMALGVLAQTATPSKALVQVAELLEDAAWPVRWAALDAVALLGRGHEQGDELTHLVAIRLRDCDWPVRLAAIRCLEELASSQPGLSDSLVDSMTSSIAALLQDPEPHVRSAVEGVLAGVAPHRRPPRS